MAGITQPTPIKPVWPTRHEQGRQRRVPQDQENRERREDQRRQDKKDGDRPVFDDYA